MEFLNLPVGIVRTQTGTTVPQSLPEHHNEDSGSDSEEIPFPHMLHILVQSATGLPAMDSNGLSDPYAILNFAEGGLRRGLRKFRKGRDAKTRPIKKTLDPEWNACLTVEVERKHMEQPLCINVWDEDRFSSDDYIGSAVVKWKELLDENDGFVTRYFTLQDDSMRGVPRGKVLCTLVYERDYVPRKLRKRDRFVTHRKEILRFDELTARQSLTTSNSRHSGAKVPSAVRKNQASGKLRSHRRAQSTSLDPRERFVTRWRVVSWVSDAVEAHVQYQHRRVDGVLPGPADSRDNSWLESKRSGKFSEHAGTDGVRYIGDGVYGTRVLHVRELNGRLLQTFDDRVCSGMEIEFCRDGSWHFLVPEELVRSPVFGKTLAFPHDNTPSRSRSEQYPAHFGKSYRSSSGVNPEDTVKRDEGLPLSPLEVARVSHIDEIAAPVRFRGSTDQLDALTQHHSDSNVVKELRQETRKVRQLTPQYSDPVFFDPRSQMKRRAALTIRPTFGYWSHNKSRNQLVIMQQRRGAITTAYQIKWVSNSATDYLQLSAPFGKIVLVAQSPGASQTSQTSSQVSVRGGVVMMSSNAHKHYDNSSFPALDIPGRALRAAWASSISSTLHITPPANIVPSSTVTHTSDTTTQNDTREVVKPLFEPCFRWRYTVDASRNRVIVGSAVGPLIQPAYFPRDTLHDTLSTPESVVTLSNQLRRGVKADTLSHIQHSTLTAKLAHLGDGLLNSSNRSVSINHEEHRDTVIEGRLAYTVHQNEAFLLQVRLDLTSVTRMPSSDAPCVCVKRVFSPSPPVWKSDQKSNARYQQWTIIVEWAQCGASDAGFPLGSSSSNRTSQQRGACARGLVKFVFRAGREGLVKTRNL